MRVEKINAPRNKNNDEVDDLVCPITLELFRDPVIAEDGHVYEREAITKWITEHGTSPFTRQPLRLNALQSDYIKKRLADQRRNSTVSFHATTNTVTLPPLRINRIGRAQITPEANSNTTNTQVTPEADCGTISTHERSFYSRALKYILISLCVCVFLIYPIVCFSVIVGNEELSSAF